MISNVIKQFSIIGFYILSSIFFTWPLITQFKLSIIGSLSDSDSTTSLWNVYIFKKSLLNHTSPFLIQETFYPIWTNMWMHGYMPMMCLFVLMFDNIVLGINIYLLLHFVLSAYGAYLLSFKLSKHTLLSIFVGIVFSFSAYKLLRASEHYMLCLTATIPFYILSFLSAFEFKEGRFIPKITSIKYFALCFVLGFFTLLNDYYSTFYLIYFSVAWCVYFKFIFYWKDLQLKYKFIYVLIFIVVMHFVVETLYNNGINDRGGIWWGGDLLSYFIPNINTLVWDRNLYDLILPQIVHDKLSFEFQMFLGYTMIGICMYIIFKKYKNQIPAIVDVWLFVLLICLFISLPAFKIFGVKLFYSPTAILHFIPFFNNIRCNTRIEVVMTLLIGIAFVLILIQNVSSKKGSFIAIVLIILYCIDIKTSNYHLIDTSKNTSLIYNDIKKSPNKILTTIPTGITDGEKNIGHFTSDQLYYQTIHHKKITGGYISRVPESTFEFYSKDPIMLQIMLLSENKNDSWKLPSQQLINQYFKNFQTDLFLITPEYQNTQAEKFIMYIIKEKKYIITKKENHSIVEIL